MPDKAKKIQELPNLSQAANVDLLIIEDLLAPSGNANSTTKSISVYNLLTNSQINVVAATLSTTHVATPANSTAITINGGEFFFDANFIYVAVSNNVVKRAALSTF